MDLLLDYLAGAWQMAFTLGMAFAGLSALEWVWSRPHRAPLVARLKAITFWLIYIAFLTVCTTALGRLRQALGVDPLLDIPMGLHSPNPAVRLAGSIAAPVVALFVSDFFFYWLHRAQHRFFWPLHSLHHSIEDVTALNSYHHWSEGAFQTLAITAPLALLIHVETPPANLLVTAYLTAYGFYLHSPTKLHFGPLRFIFGDNRFHRVHHSVEPRHFDKNFGAATPLWDVLFRTAYFPVKGEWPRTGVADRPEPQGVTQYLGWSLPARRAKAAAAKTTYGGLEM